MNTHRLLVLALILGLLLPPTAAAAPLAGPCVPGATYNSACDANQDGSITVTDIQLTAGHWNQTGTFVSDNNHTHLGQTWTGSNNPLKIQGPFGAPDYAGLVLSNSSSTGVGIRITSSGMEGIYVDSAGTVGLAVASAVDGVYIRRAGSPSTFPPSSLSNGFEVAGAQGNGLHVGRADNDGVAVNAAGQDGVYVGTAGSPSGSLANPAPDGFEIAGAQGNGLYVGRADNDGVAVNNAGQDGVYVGVAGNPPSFVVPSTAANGFEVAGTQGNGLYVGRADGVGVLVNSANYGVVVNSASNGGVSVGSVGFDGVFVGEAGYDGVRVFSAGHDGVNVAGNNLAGYFSGPVQIIGGCTGCLLATFGVNSGDKPLAPGDLVSLAGLRASGVDSVPMLMEVKRATVSDAVVGVVQGWAELVTEEEPRPDEIGLRLVPREGSADPGQYVTIAYSGLTQVKASGPVVQGSKLAAGGDGAARALRTVTVDGVELAENASVIGVALEELVAGNWLVWVLLNVQ